MDLNELQSQNIRELSKLAQKLNIDGGIAGLNRQTLIIKILEAQRKERWLFFCQRCFGGYARWLWFFAFS